jgi:Holliday junction resolvase RusA-like endonuclease
MTTSRAKPAEAPGMPSNADLAECARRRISYVALVAERCGVQPGESFTVAPYAPPRSLTIALPWSALQTGNRFFGLTSKAYRAAKEKAVGLVAEQVGLTRPVFLTPVRLTVTLYMPNEQRRDVLNYAKLIADALTGYAYRDDSQVHEATFVRLVDVDAPRAVVAVAPMTGEDYRAA